MKRYWGLLLVLLLSFWAIAPFFQPGFFPIHDNTQIVRVQQMSQALQEGQFPVRWVGDLGYGFGYPIFNFYAPLAYYIGAFFNLIGFNVLLATKLMFVVGILLSGISMYFLAREFWGEVGGILSALFYVYAPYHAIDIYVRGAVGEFWAMAFLPLVFYGLYKLIQKKKWPWVVISSLAYAAVILSHNLTAIITVLFVFLIGLVLFIFSKKKKELVINCLLFIVLALGLSAFYWLPALSEMNLTKVFGQIGGGADWRDHFVFLDQLWASPWGFGGSASGRLDGMSFMIGKIHIIFTAFSLLTAAWFWKERKKKAFFSLLISLSLFILSVFFTNQLSSFIWKRIPFLAFIQYPWRFLIITTFAASFIAGSAAMWFKKNTRFVYLGGGVIILALLFFNIKYFKPQVYFNVSAADYVSEENIKWQTSKISDEYLPRDFPIPQNKNEVAWEKVAILEGEAKIKDLVLKSHQYVFDIEVETETEVLVNTAYFPEWKILVNDQEKDFVVENGKMKFSLQPGNYHVFVHLESTSVRIITNLISLISWLVLIGLVLAYVRIIL